MTRCKDCYHGPMVCDLLDGDVSQCHSFEDAETARETEGGLQMAKLRAYADPDVEEVTATITKTRDLVEFHEVRGDTC